MNTNPTNPTSIADKARALAKKINKDNRLQAASLLLCAGIAITISLLAKPEPKADTALDLTNKIGARFRIQKGDKMYERWMAAPPERLFLKPIDKIPSEYQHVWRKMKRTGSTATYVGKNAKYLPDDGRSAQVVVHSIVPQGPNPYVVVSYMSGVGVGNDHIIPIISIPKEMIEDDCWQKLLTAPAKDLFSGCYVIPGPPKKMGTKDGFPITRTLTSKDGNTVETTITSIKNGSLIGKRTDTQKEITIPFNLLSAEDQTFFREKVDPSQKKLLVIGEMSWDSLLETNDSFQPTYLVLQVEGKGEFNGDDMKNPMCYSRTAEVETTYDVNGMFKQPSDEALTKIIKQYDAIWIGNRMGRIDQVKIAKLATACRKPFALRFPQRMKTCKEFINHFESLTIDRSRELEYTDYISIDDNCLFFNDEPNPHAGDQPITHNPEKTEEALEALVRMMKR